MHSIRGAPGAQEARERSQGDAAVGRAVGGAEAHSARRRPRALQLLERAFRMLELAEDAVGNALCPEVARFAQTYQCAVDA